MLAPSAAMCKALDDWLRRNEISDAAFARTLGLRSRASVTRYRSGIRMPEPPIMARIIAATAGAVQPNDFYAAHEPTLSNQSNSETESESGTAP